MNDHRCTTILRNIKPAGYADRELEKTYSIRNLSVIAHINHGKSTLSSKMREFCGAGEFSKSTIRKDHLLRIESERGMTIKARSTSMKYTSDSGTRYTINLIDTPGHTDFSHEVSKFLRACEGVILVVDVTRGIESQTMSNYLKAKEMNLRIIPVVNKIDLDSSRLEETVLDMEGKMDIGREEIVCCSARCGIGIDRLLEKVVKLIPPPADNSRSQLRAIIVDSWFDRRSGIICLLKISCGSLQRGDKIRIGAGRTYRVCRVGIFTPEMVDLPTLGCGSVGWMICNIRDVVDITAESLVSSVSLDNRDVSERSGKPESNVYANLFPAGKEDPGALRRALAELSLGGCPTSYSKERSCTFGSGFRCGFSGPLQIEVLKDRLRCEYDIDPVITDPTVTYQVLTNRGGVLLISDPNELPASTSIDEIREPISECHIRSPLRYVGNITRLCAERRGTRRSISCKDDHASMVYEIPTSEVLSGFYDDLKSTSSGYASLEHSFKYFRKSDLICVDILVNGEKIRALTSMVHRSKAERHGRSVIDKVRDLIPRRQFSVKIQALAGSKVIAKVVVRQFRKDVTAKCYGGDVTRKKKLLRKQKIGKKLLNSSGRIRLTPDVTSSVLNLRIDGRNG